MQLMRFKLLEETSQSKERKKDMGIETHRMINWVSIIDKIPLLVIFDRLYPRKSLGF